MNLSYRNSDILIDCRTPLKRVAYRSVGGKAWNLFRLRSFGFAVPPWCVVTSLLFDDLLSGKREHVNEILSSLDYSCSESLEAATIQIGSLLRASFDRSHRQEELASSLGRWADGTDRFAVRSSVVGEDSSENSFAGLMDSFVNIPPQHLLEHVVKVWASAFSERALAYRHHKSLDVTSVSTGVIVQHVAVAQKSGVMFTRDPDSGDERCIISAGFGFGEGVVGNQVETDTYHVSLATDSITKEIVKKTLRVTVAGNQSSGTSLEPLPQNLEMLPVLNDQEILKLRNLGIEAEKRFGCPQDMEWNFDANDQLFVLQSRPIVLTKSKAGQQTARIWDNSNIVESYPGITSPLTFTFVRRGYEESFRKAARGFFLSEKSIRDDELIFKNMIGLIEGRIYYNLLNWYRMLSHLPGFNKHKRSWDQMIGITQKIQIEQIDHPLFTRVSSFLILVARLLSVRGNARKFFRRYDRIYWRYNGIDISASEGEEIIREYESLCRDLSEFWHLTLYNDLAAMKYYDWLKILCEKWIVAGNENLHNNLLCGESGVESVKPVRSIVRIAEMIRGIPEYLDLMNRPDQEVWDVLCRSNRFAPIRGALADHLERYGDRGLEELKLERPSFRARPAALIALLRQYCHIGLTVEEMERQEQRIRTHAEEIVRSQCKGWMKKLVFRFVLRNARAAVVNRENMRFARTRVYGIVRGYFARLGELLKEKRILSCSEDLHFLTVDEVFGFIQGTAVTQNLKALADLRKREYEAFAQTTPDERIETKGIPYLSSFQRSTRSVGRLRELRGIGCSSGLAEGEADVVLDPRDGREHSGQILIARSTDPGWVFLMISSKGIVVEKGSVLSHTAIIGRELGIPTVVGVRNATNIIQHGARLSVNGSTGVVQCQ